MKLLRNFLILTSMAFCCVASLTTVSSAGAMLAPVSSFDLSYAETFYDAVQSDQSVVQELDEDRAVVASPDVGDVATVYLPNKLRSQIQKANASNCNHATLFSSLEFENQKAGNLSNPKLDNRL